MPEVAGQWRQAAAALIEAAIPANTDAPEAWPACAALLPHAQAALTADSPGMARIANYLGVSGSYAAACELQQRVLDARHGSSALSTRTPWPPGTTSLTGPGWRGRGRGPRPVRRRCCPSASGSSALSTRTP